MEPPSCNLTVDYFLLGIVLILILLVNSLVKGIEIVLLSSGEKEEEEEAIQFAFIQAEAVLITSTLLTVLSILRLFMNVGEGGFIFYSLSFFVTVILLFLTGRIFRRTAITQGFDFVKKRKHLISVIYWFGKPLYALIAKLKEIYGKVAEEVTAQSIEEITEVDDTMDKEEVEEKLLLKGIVGFQNRSAKDIMTPRISIVSLDKSMKSRDVIAKVIECGFSRLPVYDGSPDNVAGFLYVKDLIGHLRDKEYNFDWHSHIREAYFIPGSKKIDDLLEEFRQKRIHLAMVVDEYGGTDGIVTLEDILEEIVGEITDESDI